VKLTKEERVELLAAFRAAGLHTEAAYNAAGRAWASRLESSPEAGALFLLASRAFDALCGLEAAAREIEKEE